LAVFDGPCLFRDMTIDTLARAAIPWRLAMTTPSLAGLWCGVRSGLGITVRTPLAIPTGLSALPANSELPSLGPIDIVLYCTSGLAPAVQIFRDLLLEVVNRALRPARS
jgi:DNA-binding transcriptional LysR family regulator